MFSNRFCKTLLKHGGQKTTTNAIFLVGYSLGFVLSTQFWKAKYAPAYHLPFGIILMGNLVSIICALLLLFLLGRENKRRDAMREEAIRTGIGKEKYEEYAEVETRNGQGKMIKTRVDKAFLDMTDRENLAFRYVL